MNKSKLILIVGAVLIVISIVLSTVSVIMVSSALKKVGSVEETKKTDEDKDIPLSQIKEHNMEESIILTLDADENSTKKLNVVLDIGFGFDSKNKKTSKAITLLTEKETIIRDRILKLLQTKTAEDFNPNNVKATEQMQEEILKLVSNELETDAIVEVYFSNILRSIK